MRLYILLVVLLVILLCTDDSDARRRRRGRRRGRFIKQIAKGLGKLAVRTVFRGKRSVDETPQFCKFEMYDWNENDVIEKSEIQNLSQLTGNAETEKRLARMDANNDNQITRDEFEVHRCTIQDFEENEDDRGDLITNE